MLSVAQALPPASWALIALCAIVVGTLHTVSGLAGGIVLSILLTPILGVERIIPVLSVALLIGSSSRLWVFRKHVTWPVYRAVMISAVPCIVLGTLIYSTLSARAISAVFGVFLIVTVIARHTLEQHRFQIGMRGFSALGALFGLVSGTTIGGGMILVPFFLGAGITGERFVAMIGSIAFTLYVTKVISLGAMSLLDTDSIVIGIVIGLCVVPGTYLGYWIVRRTPIRVHSAFVEAIVVVGALSFLWSAISPS